jgi:hypothetical protein
MLFLYREEKEIREEKEKTSIYHFFPHMPQSSLRFKV